MRVVVHKSGEGGVAFYRTIQPYTNLKKLGVDVFIFDPNKNNELELRGYQEHADALVFQMPWGSLMNHIMDVNDARKERKKIIIEVDDYIFCTNPFNDAYRMFGLEEVQNILIDKPSIDRHIKLGFKECKTLLPTTEQHLKKFNLKRSDVFIYDLWKDGEKEFNLQKNITAAEETKRAYQRADVLTCTTMGLGEKLRKIRTKGEIAILPNLVDCDRWLPMKKNKTDEIRIGWQGGSAHFMDLLEVTKALDVIMNKYPKAKLVFKGGHFPSLFEQWGKRVEWLPWHGDIETYPLDVRDMKLDIAIAPLINDEFNQSKSELKWLEYSIMKTPGVFSEVCYKPHINYGKTGFIARNIQEWVDCLSRLIESPELRQEIAEKAYTRVSNYHSIQAKGHLWKDMLTKLIYQKELVAA